MSDFHIYDLEEIVWDDFSISDDRLVPHPKIGQNEGNAFQAESHKKLKQEVRMTGSTDHYDVAARETSLSSPIMMGEQVLANGSWSCNLDTFQTYEELMPCLLSGGQTVAASDFISNSSIFTVDPTPVNNCATAGENVSSLSDVNPSERNLSFLSNGHDYKEFDDSLFYEWPDIGNFEDVDQLLRTCDSTFGLGDLGNEYDMCWLSSSTTINEADAASNTKARSSNSDSDSLQILSENIESPHDRNYESTEVVLFNKRSVGVSCTSLSSNTTEQSCLSKPDFIIETPTSLNNTDEEKSLKKISHNKNSGVDTKSVEETSFRQLQEVIQHLDLNTKLRIRDSLYRLARSAEQRHGVATMSKKANKHSNEALLAETKYFVKLHPHYLISLGCAGLLDIETDTNPIDRTIAHLLFHRPDYTKSLSDPRSLNNASMEVSPPDEDKVGKT